MNKRDKIEIENLESLESEFSALLVPCLSRCAKGRWGLFGAYDKFPEVKHWINWPDADRLREIAKQIQEIRLRFGESNDLCEQFLSRCVFRQANDPGEPRMAREYLDQLEKKQAKENYG